MPISLNKKDSVCVTRFKPGCRQLLFLYQGGAGMLFIPPLRFLRQSGAKRRSLAMFRDAKSNYYHGKIHPEWPDIESTISNQREIKAQCVDATELYCTGTSAGGYASMLFGHYLEADIVYAFGAQTLIDMGRIDPGIEIPLAHQDLSIILSDWNGRTRYRMYYSEGYEPDRIAAERMVDCPGVELCPVPGKTHNVFKDIDSAALLGNLLPPLEDSKWWTRNNSKKP